MANFSLKKGILQKNIPSFFTFWQKNSKIKNIASCRFESYFSGQFGKKFANNQNTSSEDICPTSAWTFISRACPTH
jgi:hypothetical protein